MGEKRNDADRQLARQKDIHTGTKGHKQEC